MPYDVKDIEMAPEGERYVRWADEHMPVLERIRERFEEERPFDGVTVGFALHVEATTAMLIRTIQAGGGTVEVTGSNPLSTDDKVAAALAEKGANIYTWRGETEEEYYRNLDRVLDREPDLIIDDGADLVSRAHEKGGKVIENLRGAAEETTTGVKRLEAMERKGDLEIPVVAVNDTPAKTLFDNRFGTGESTVNAIMSITNSLMAGRNVVVVGYGYVGRGIALRARGLGSKVTVVETDPIKALEATMRGFQVSSMDEAAERGEIFITATGNLKVIRKEHLDKMKDGAMLCNSGHFNVEIDLEGLEELSVETRDAVEDVREYEMEDGRKLYVLAEGRLVNLAGERSLGHPAEIMDMSFALQALTAEHLLEEGLPVGVHDVPAEIDREVAELKLEEMGINLEEPTREQEEYIESWKLGT